MGEAMTIGLVAGRGQFPLLVARAARSEGKRVACLSFTGFSDPELPDASDVYAELPLGQLGKHIAFFKDNGVVELTFAGAIAKPKAMDLKPDWRAAKVIFRLRSKGDDALLRAVIAELESEGFKVRQAADLVPGLRGPAGVLSRRQPNADEWDDLRLGFGMAKEMGRLDIGQCLVLKRGVIAAVEALEGTDAAIRRGGQLAGPGAVVVKTVKPGQEERIDLPAIGPGTIAAMREVGASCLGYEAGKTLFFDREQSLAQANEMGVAVVGLDHGNL